MFRGLSQGAPGSVRWHGAALGNGDGQLHPGDVRARPPETICWLNSNTNNEIANTRECVCLAGVPDSGLVCTYRQRRSSFQSFKFEQGNCSIGWFVPQLTISLLFFFPSNFARALRLAGKANPSRDHCSPISSCFPQTISWTETARTSEAENATRR